MKVLGNDEPILIWGAERAFQIQLLAALARVGSDVLGLISDPQGKKIVDQFHPKNTLGPEIPESFSGHLLWAPGKELFSNTPLHQESLNELSQLNSLRKNNSRIKNFFWLLPQAAHSQLPSELHQDKILFFPSLVGFGDQFVFETLLDEILKNGLWNTDIEGEFLSIFDAISFTLSFLKSTDKDLKIWANGHPLKPFQVNSGFAELKEDSPLFGFIKSSLSSLFQKKTKLSALSYDKPKEIPLALEVFPTVLTSWERFFRDSSRIYKSTQDEEVLLHFRPTQTP